MPPEYYSPHTTTKMLNFFYHPLSQYCNTGGGGGRVSAGSREHLHEIRNKRTDILFPGSPKSGRCGCVSGWPPWRRWRGRTPGPSPSTRRRRVTWQKKTEGTTSNIWNRRSMTQYREIFHHQSYFLKDISHILAGPHICIFIFHHVYIYIDVYTFVACSVQ